MNTFLRITIFVWLLLCALVAWVGAACVGFLFVFSSAYGVASGLTPFIGLTIGICIIRTALQVLKSNPATYIEEWFFGKEKI